MGGGLGEGIGLACWGGQGRGYVGRVDWSCFGGCQHLYGSLQCCCCLLVRSGGDAA